MNLRRVGHAVLQGALAAIFALLASGIGLSPLAILMGWAGGPRAASFVFLLSVIIAIFCGILTTWGALRLHTERRRAEDGQCQNCGYDLRGSNGRCPECGQVYARRDAALYYDYEGMLTKTHALQTPTPKPPGQTTA